MGKGGKKRKIFKKKKTCLDNKPKGIYCYKVKGGWSRTKRR